jgi:hypothetical protein
MIGTKAVQEMEREGMIKVRKSGSERRSEGAPVVHVLETCSKTAIALVFRPLLRDGCIHGRGGHLARAVAVVAASTQLLPVAELAVATVARPMLNSVRMESGVLVELDEALRVLPAKDTTALAAVVATVEEAEGRLTSRCRADECRAVGLEFLLVSLDEA